MENDEQTGASPAGLWPPASFLAHLAEPDRARVLAAGTVRRFGAGGALLHEGDQDTSLLVIVAGAVKVVGHTEDGDVTLLSVRARGDVVGELAMIDGRPRSASVVAIRESAVREISKAAFDRLTEERPLIGLSLLQVGVGKLREATRYRIDAGGGTALVRLARVLDTVLRSHGVAHEDGMRVGIPFSQTDLAELTGLSEASVQRAMRELRDKKIVTTGYLGFTVHKPDRLRRVAEDGG